MKFVQTTLIEMKSVKQQQL